MYFHRAELSFDYSLLFHTHSSCVLVHSFSANFYLSFTQCPHLGPVCSGSSTSMSKSRISYFDVFSCSLSYTRYTMAFTSTPLISCRCAHCGMAFTLPQEVSRHVREATCMLRPDEHKSDIPSGERVPKNVTVSSTSTGLSRKDEKGRDCRSITCSQCSYSTESRAELLFHEVLHGEPITDPSVIEDPSDLQVGLGTITAESQVMSLFACRSLSCFNSV